MAQLLHCLQFWGVEIREMLWEWWCCDVDQGCWLKVVGVARFLLGIRHTSFQGFSAAKEPATFWCKPVSLETSMEVDSKLHEKTRWKSFPFPSVAFPAGSFFHQGTIKRQQSSSTGNQLRRCPITRQNETQWCHDARTLGEGHSHTFHERSRNA